MAFEKYLVDYCSPTLASVKTANLFNWFYESSTELWEQVSYWNLLMNPKGVYLYVLKEHPKKALIYVCRKSRLAENLSRPGVAAFLENRRMRRLHDFFDLFPGGSGALRKRPVPHRRSLCGPKRGSLHFGSGSGAFSGFPAPGVNSSRQGRGPDAHLLRPGPLLLIGERIFFGGIPLLGRIICAPVSF